MYNTFTNDEWGGGGCVPCTMSMASTNYSCYNIQLSLYKYILEKYYNVVIDAMYLVVLHPNQTRFICMPVQWEYLKPTFEKIIDYRLTCV